MAAATAPAVADRRNTSDWWSMRAENLRLAFGAKVVLGGIDLDIKPGTVTLLRGPNGAGKTSLIEILCGMLEPTAGRVTMRQDGEATTIRFPKPRWRKVLQLAGARPEQFARWGTART